MIHCSKVGKYFDLLNKLWAKGYFQKPIDPTFIKFKLFKGKDGHLIGWEITNRDRVEFNGSPASVTLNVERMRLDRRGEFIRVSEHAYHYQADEAQQGDFSFRIDLNESQGLHANPDQRLLAAGKLQDHLGPGQIKLGITDFSVLYFLWVSVIYRQGFKYPLDPNTDDIYNHSLTLLRKQVQAG